MNIGDLVFDERNYLAIITSQVGFQTDRWRIKYINTGCYDTAWASNLYPIRS